MSGPGTDEDSALAHLLRLAREPNFAHLATVRADGSAAVTPLWIDVDADGALLINGTRDRGWVKHLRRCSAVTVSVSAASNPYEAAAARGHLVPDATIDAREHFDRLYRKYRGRPLLAGVDPGERILLRLAPEESTYRFEPPPGSGGAMDLWLRARASVGR
jgi:hypothetical protein